MADIPSILERLKRVRPSQNGWSACCPAHEDKSPSLSVTQGDDGRILLNCHAGCEIEAICAALGIGMGELFAKEPRPFKIAKPKPVAFGSFDEIVNAAIRGEMKKRGGQWKLVKSYAYGPFTVLRIESGDAKSFRPVYPFDGAWSFGYPNGPRPLYRQDKIADGLVYVCEGEKATDAAAELGLNAACSAGGSKAAGKSDWSALTSRPVAVLVDNDEPGRKYGSDVVRQLRRLDPTADVRVVSLPDLGEGEDIVEFVALRRGQGKDDDEIRAEIVGLVEAAKPKATERPKIIVVGGDLHEVVEKSEQALIDAGEEVFQQHHRIVRVIRHAQVPPLKGVRRAEGAVIVRSVEPVYLMDRLTALAEFLRFDGRSCSYKAIDCSEKTAKTLLAREGKWKLRPLSGVIEAPTLRSDGSILDEPGYDEKSGLYLASGQTFPSIPRAPVQADAQKGLEVFKTLLKDFPFVTDADRSVVLALILSVLVRRSLPTAPLTAITAPVMASGKTLLASLASILATGRSASMIAQGTTEEEDKKRYLAMLLGGDPVICIDNVERPFGGAALCSILTETSYSDRLLGKSELAAASTNASWIVTGNNLVFEGDIKTRVVHCSLDPQMERPEEREFDVDLREHFLENRGELVAAALTVLRAYHVAGRPSQGLTPFGRFEGWSDWVRSALVWAGEDDPCATRGRFEEIDPVTRRLRVLLQLWHERFGDTPMTLRDVVKRTETTDRNDPLYVALLEIAEKRDGAVDTRRAGRWIESKANRIADGLRVERAGARQGTALWSVSKVGSSVGVVGVVGSLHTQEENCQMTHSVVGVKPSHDSHDSHGTR